MTQLVQTQLVKDSVVIPKPDVLVGKKQFFNFLGTYYRCYKVKTLQNEYVYFVCKYSVFYDFSKRELTLPLFIESVVLWGDRLRRHAQSFDSKKIDLSLLFDRNELGNLRHHEQSDLVEKNKIIIESFNDKEENALLEKEILINIVHQALSSLVENIFTKETINETLLDKLCSVASEYFSETYYHDV